MKVSGDPIFLTMCKQFDVPAPTCEFEFDPKRKWRFDYSWKVPYSSIWVALEVEGGAWTRGRHTRGKGFESDISKYNSALLLGWRVLRCTPDTLRTMATIEMIRTLLGRK